MCGVVRCAARSCILVCIRRGGLASSSGRRRITHRWLLLLSLLGLTGVWWTSAVALCLSAEFELWTVLRVWRRFLHSVGCLRLAGDWLFTWLAGWRGDGSTRPLGSRGRVRMWVGWWFRGLERCFCFCKETGNDSDMLIGRCLGWIRTIRHERWWWWCELTWWPRKSGSLLRRFFADCGFSKLNSTEHFDQWWSTSKHQWISQMYFTYDSLSLMIDFYNYSFNTWLCKLLCFELT